MSKGRKRFLWLTAALGLFFVAWAAAWIIVANSKPEPTPAPADLPAEGTARLTPEFGDMAGPKYRWRYKITSPHYWGFVGGGDDEDRLPDRTISLSWPKPVKDWSKPKNLQFVEFSFTVGDTTDGDIWINWSHYIASSPDMGNASGNGWSWNIKKCDLSKLVKPQIVEVRTLPIPSKVALFVCEAEGIDGKPKRQTISLKLAE